MSIDQAILQRCQPDDPPTLRFYGWQPATLSLGYFQAATDRRRHPASVACPVVRRSSGGGAILHDRELTYSIVLPVDFLARLGPAMAVYRMVHQAVIECLGDLAIVARRHGDDAVAAGEQQTAQQEPFLCFQRRTAEDLTVSGYKILGSAQRKSRHAVLQHGSLLLAASPAAPELPGLLELVSKRVEPGPFSAQLAAKLGNQLRVRWSEGELNNGEANDLASIASEKYASLDWLNKR